MLRLLCLVALCVLLFFVGVRMLGRGSSVVLSSAPAAVSSAAAGSSDTSFSLVGRPSVSASFMNRVLAAYHSPAVGLGSDLYADGVRSGIDSVYALAFFLHESGMGTQGVARLTHSLGNIRCSSGYTCLDGFRAYPSWAAGAADWFALIVSVYLPAGRSTVPSIVVMYAPSSENDTAAYVAAVERAVTLWRSGAVLV